MYSKSSSGYSIPKPQKYVMNKNNFPNETFTGYLELSTSSKQGRNTPSLHNNPQLTRTCFADSNCMKIG